MISRSSSPVMLMSAIGLITLGFLAPWAPQELSPTQAGTGSGVERIARTPAIRRAGQPPPSPVTIVSTGTVTVDADGYAPVTLTCNGQCMQGRFMLELSGWSNPQGMSWVTGRSDLLVNAGATRTIGVPLAAATIALCDPTARRL